MGSIKSILQFVSYKVDSINLATKNTLGVVGNYYSGHEDWKFQYGLAQPIYFKDSSVYVTGTTVKAFCGSQADPDVSLDISISGVFMCEGEKETPVDDDFIKVQMPAILSPYLRGAITYILAMAGFGQVIPPLVNFRNMAEEALKDIPILIESGQPEAIEEESKDN